MSETRELSQDREPGMYEIRLKGHLDSRWSHKFEGMSFTHKTDGTTVLSGPLADQSELHGLLRKLRDLGLSLISINQMDSNKAIGSDGNSGKTN
ncbi:hypothetical protein [Neobacillus sp. YIM B06451]|uniref:hypothetical protein n=1 Tax=Neobacillus sp. YIM B06451 TaxID=3070994 RepID=UPI0029319739|nr:hypothetical protein [Neobacillus sp. YIM B06451]